MTRALMVVLALSVAACGSEETFDARPAPSRPGGNRPPGPSQALDVEEICTVSFADDGSVACSCRPRGQQ